MVDTTALQNKFNTYSDQLMFSSDDNSVVLKVENITSERSIVESDMQSFLPSGWQLNYRFELDDTYLTFVFNHLSIGILILVIGIRLIDSIIKLRLNNIFILNETYKFPH